MRQDTGSWREQNTKKDCVCQCREEADLREKKGTEDAECSGGYQQPGKI